MSGTGCQVCVNFQRNIHLVRLSLSGKKGDGKLWHEATTSKYDGFPCQLFRWFTSRNGGGGRGGVTGVQLTRSPHHLACQFPIVTDQSFALIKQFLSSGTFQNPRGEGGSADCHFFGC